MSTRTKKIAAHILIWSSSVLAGAAALALFDDMEKKSYWTSVAMLAALMLTMLVAFWIRDERPKRGPGLWAIALALIIPPLILLFSFGPGPAAGALAGGLTVALIITWSFLTGKEDHPEIAGEWPKHEE